MQSFIHHYGYAGLFLVAILESMCVPIPSEVTFAFGGALCTTAVATGKPLNIGVVILLGVLGSVVGSIIAYEVGRSAGRAIVDKWGKWVLLTHKDLDTAELWFDKYGSVSVLVGRVIPIVRSVISLPAGVAEMKRGRFIVLTTVGSAVWVSLLTGLGYAAGANWNSHVAKYFHYVQWPVVAIVVLLLVYGYRRRFKTVRAQQSN
jgi:membrane protein DedA with SNARE-associated domain